MDRSDIYQDCDQVRAQMFFYLDDELHDGERAEFEAHLGVCGACRELCAHEASLLKGIRELSPLYEGSDQLRERVRNLLTEIPEHFAASPSLRDRILKTLHPSTVSPSRNRWKLRLVGLAAVGLALTFGIIGFFFSRSEIAGRAQPSQFALMAVDTHMRRLRGQLPLEIVSDSPQAISSWFSGKVSFGLKLPNYQEASGQDKIYRLEGARLVGFNNDYAAFIAYQMRGRPITLVVTSRTVAQPAGGEKIISKGLTFHYDSIDGLKVITWMDHGLTYALVSDLEERGQQSCMVCHAGTKDRDFIEGLKLSKKN